MLDEDQVLILLIELKEDVASLRRDVKDVAMLRVDVDKMRGKINIVQGIALAAGAVCSLLVALFGKFYRPS